MRSGIVLVTLVVDDYDEAIGWFTDALGFELVEDSPRGPGKRWVVVAPPGADGAALLLAQGDGEQQRDRIGDQTGGRVGFFLHTPDFAVTGTQTGGPGGGHGGPGGPGHGDGDGDGPAAPPAA